MKLPILALALLITTPAFAQTPAPSSDQIREDANALISAVHQQRDANADQLAQAMAQIAKLQKALDATKVKPEVKK